MERGFTISAHVDYEVHFELNDNSTGTLPLFLVEILRKKQRDLYPVGFNPPFNPRFWLIYMVFADYGE